ncbi:hypothetical protein KMZ32_10310 [Phycicoccus sp. MAQZ13P-2]|nr:hypothetical protein [Phycicoccus mangrovi]MBT9274460.1 hypothetical protein [Phycicoccus mangrovi]
MLREPPTFKGWQLSLCAAAGEAGGSFVSSRPRPPGVRVGPAADPERAREEAGRRARSRMRRYCAANRLNRLGTLTYAGAGVHDPRQARADVGVFFRRLRAETGGKPFPYVWVPEWHKSGHGLHLHFAVGDFIARGKIDRAWGRGFVHIKLLGDLPVGSGSFAQSRKAAGYLSKYVGKSFDDDAAGVKRPKGLHRFDVAQGYTPKRVLLQGASRDEVLEAAAGAMGGPPDVFWSSDEAEGWQGPPTVWVQWRG